MKKDLYLERAKNYFISADIEIADHISIAKHYKDYSNRNKYHQALNKLVEGGIVSKSTKRGKNYYQLLKKTQQYKAYTNKTIKRIYQENKKDFDEIITKKTMKTSEIEFNKLLMIADKIKEDTSIIIFLLQMEEIFTTEDLKNELIRRKLNLKTKLYTNNRLKKSIK